MPAPWRIPLGERSGSAGPSRRLAGSRRQVTARRNTFRRPFALGRRWQLLFRRPEGCRGQITGIDTCEPDFPVPVPVGGQPLSEALDRSSPAAGVATGRDWQRSLTFFVVLGSLTVPFLLLLLLVTDKWAPLAAADQGARDSLH